MSHKEKEDKIPYGILSSLPREPEPTSGDVGFRSLSLPSI